MKKLFTLFFCFMLMHGLIAQPGILDLNFNPGDLGFGHGDGANEWISAMAEQPDGKILIGGAFTTYNGIARNRIARIYPDGSLDHTFDPGSGFSGYGSYTYVSEIVLQADGKILVGGDFTHFNDSPANHLLRLHPDGSIDTTFLTGSGTNGPVWAININTDNTIMIGGSFSLYNGMSRSNIACLLSDGNIDIAFNPDAGTNGPVYTIAEHSDGRILLGGYFNKANNDSTELMARLLPDGMRDQSFNTVFSVPGLIPFDPPRVHKIIIEPDDKIIATGTFTSYYGENARRIIRLHEDGQKDTTFNSGTGAVGPMYPILTNVFSQADKYIVTGKFRSFSGFYTNGIARLNNDGSVDTTFFTPGHDVYVSSAIPLEDEQILIGGSLNGLNNLITNTNILRLNENGDLDLTFNEGTGANRMVYASAVLDDGMILIGGDFQLYNGEIRKNVARLHPNGELDANFVTPADVNDLTSVYAIASQNDGKVVVGGSFRSAPAYWLLRLNNDGSIDQDFDIGTGANNTVSDIAIQSDHKIIAAGGFTSFNTNQAGRIVRLNPDGENDPEFNTGTGANGHIYSISLQADGKIMIGGTFSSFNNVSRLRIARLNSDGSLDQSFDPGSGAGGGAVFATAIQDDGRIVIAGSFTSCNGIPLKGIARLNPDGSLDTTFDPGQGANHQIEDVIIQQNGKIIIGGLFTIFDGNAVNRIARLNADGSLDTAFQTGSGFNGRVNTLSLQADGHIIAGGWFTAYNGIGRNRIARIFGDEAVGISQIDKTRHWIAFPNPASRNIILQSDAIVVNATIRLVDLQGRIILEKAQINEQQFNLDISRVSPGVYVLEIRQMGQIERIKIIRQ